MLVTPPQSVGSIGPERPLSSDVVSFIESGQCHIPYKKPTDTPACICMDGRPSQLGPLVGISMPGGTLAPVVIASALLATNGVDHAVKDLIPIVMDVCDDNNFPIGVHYAGSQEGSGCGAMDGLETVVSLTNRRAEAIAMFANDLGLPSPTPLDMGSVDNCSDLFSVFHDNNAPFVKLLGDHHESGVVINHRDNYVLDRHHLNERFAPIQLFNVDWWAFPAVADIAIDTAKRYATPAISADHHQALSIASAYVTACIMSLCREGVRIIKNA